MNKEVNHRFLQNWRGLRPSRFVKYRKWINRQHPGICGTYVTAVMVHDFMLHEYKVNLDKDELLMGMQSVVDDLFPYRGTFLWDLKHGLNYVLSDVPGVTAKMHLIPDKKAVEILSGDNPRPLAIGTAGLLGNKYNNHWLLIYAYTYDKEGNLYFKGYDNHGRHDAIIKASQSLSLVWLEENKN